MTFIGVTAILLLCTALLVIMFGWVVPELAFMTLLIIYTSFDIVDAHTAFSGFSNTGMLTIAGFFVVASGIRETGAMIHFSNRVFGSPKSERQALIRLVIPTILASSFLNNTTVVSTLMPIVSDWSKKIKVPVSKLLMPLSFASILGGMCTLIGTGTNLIVAGMVSDLLQEHPSLQPIAMFDITMISLLPVLIGTIVLVFLAPPFLLDRKPPVSTSDDPKEYTMELIVEENSHFIGKSIDDAGLRHLPGAFLMEILRSEEVFHAVSSSTTLQAKDQLIFVGDIEAMVDLQRLPGLTAAPDQVFKLDGPRLKREIIEAVVSSRNPFVGQTIRDTRFRTHYQAVIIAVARAGQRVGGRLGDIRLQTGDVLLLEAPRDFLQTQRNRTDFILVSNTVGAKPPRFERAMVAISILVFVILLFALNIVPPVTAAFLGAGLMVVTRCCTLMEAKESLDLSVLVTIAAALGIGETIEALEIHRWFAQVIMSSGINEPFWALIIVYGCTFLATELITNSAAAVIMVPIAIEIAQGLHVDPMPFIFIIMIAASSSFLTPMGYQTNLMVLNAGGYQPWDYTKLGLPLSITIFITTITVISISWNF